MHRATKNAIAKRASGVPIGRVPMRVCRWAVALLAIVIATGLSSSRAAAQSTCPAGFTQVTCPGTPEDVFVIDHPMCLEANCVFHRIRIESGGELRVPDETQRADAKKIQISTTRIIVKAGGVFQVGPLTNNRLALTFTGDRPAVVVVDRDWGGEIKIRAGFTQIQIQGVQLEKFGKAKRGSYPIHFHMDEDLTLTPDNAKLVDANSIDHSYNKCITIHSTQKLALSNNVCARIVGHIFYEEIGDEFNITFNHNLGLGAMSNNFNIAETNKANPRKTLIDNYWWTGDYLANGSTTDIGYDGFDIPNGDTHDNPVHGSCAQLMADGNIGDGLPNAVPPECPAGTVSTEPAAGFWLVNPSAILTNNSIGGCQGVGVGYWYVTSPDTKFQFLQLGGFLNNRAHACFDGLYGENQFTVHSAQNLNPHVGGLPGGQPVIAKFDGLRATRNRDRGVWVRPLWNVVTNSAFAANRDSVTLLTAGGVDGTAPGAWDLLHLQRPLCELQG